MIYSVERLAIFTCTCVISFLLGVPILVIGSLLKYEVGTECESFVNAPLITLGALILFFSAVGILWGVRGQGFQVCCHGYIMFVLLTTLLGYSIFALVVSAKGGGEPLARRGYKEYRLEDYSSWLKKRVDNTKHWNQLKTCIYKSQVCTKFGDKFGDNTQDQFYSNKLSSIESGCCKPSNDCSFKYISPTEWTKPKEENYTNEDCKKWGNEKDVLCFNCQSCKAGLADSVKRKWHKAGIICIILVISLMIFSYEGLVFLENILEKVLKHRNGPDP